MLRRALGPRFGLFLLTVSMKLSAYRSLNASTVSCDATMTSDRYAVRALHAISALREQRAAKSARPARRKQRQF